MIQIPEVPDLLLISMDLFPEKSARLPDSRLFFDDPLNGPEIYHSTAAAMRSMRKNVPEADEAEAQKKTTEKK